MLHGPTPRQDAVLVLERDPAELARAVEAIVRQVPSVLVTAITTLEEYHAALAAGDFDIVVLDHSIGTGAACELIHELRLKDAEPGVLVVASPSGPRLPAEFSHGACHASIIKEGRWQEDLGPAVRHLLRMRRLEDENRRLLARLTEANLMLEEKNRRLDEFSATVAHDIRGPLGGISMKLDYILDVHGEELDERCRGLLRRALSSSERLTGIVQSMYEYAKIGSRAAKMSAIDLAALVGEVVHDLHLSEKLDVRIGIGDLPQVWGNPELLRRVFLNLLGNSVKYNDNEIIIINIAFEGVLERSLAPFARISVTDNGRGISPDEQKTIFSMFSRGVSAGTAEGIGIGLAVVQRILDLHYGRVEVSSEPGVGTKFTMTLPMERIDLGVETR